jgi:hypothetical protein
MEGGAAPPLPPGWQLVYDNYGRPMYWNSATNQSSWAPPTIVPVPAVSPSRQIFTGVILNRDEDTPLPPGWEQKNEGGRTYFIDHNTKVQINFNLKHKSRNCHRPLLGKTPD